MARQDRDHADSVVLRQWLEDRDRGRRDLYFLANSILGYTDIQPAVHAPMIDMLQKFPGCQEIVDKSTGKIIESTPRIPLWNLKGNRRTLALMPRGGLKTTVTMAWALQWLLNYPDCRILFNMSADTRSREIATEILSHLRYNEKFRFLYPEYCPAPEKVADFGSMEYFNLPNRKVYRRAPNVSFASVGKIIAGPHYELVIHSDIIDENNINTPTGIARSINHFRACMPLVESSTIAPYTGWVAVEGTIYSFADLYSYLLEMIDSGNDYWKVWKYILIDAEKDSAKQISYWPERFPWERLMHIKTVEAGPVLYAANYRQKPIPEGGGLTDRPIDIKPARLLKSLLPQMRLHCTVDLHGMEDNLGNDYTVLTVCGFMRDGRVIVLDVRRGHFAPLDTINLMFELDTAWGNRILDFKIEKDAHMRVLGPWMQHEMQRRQKYLRIIPLKRDSAVSKPHRIRGLQSWFATSSISFSDAIACLDDVVLEIKQFPKGRHDDILDTLADQMQNQDGTIETDIKGKPKEPDPTLPGLGPHKFTGFDPITHEATWSDYYTEAGIPTGWNPSEYDRRYGS